MKPQLQLLDHTTVVVSPSQLEKIRTCAKMWFYTHMCRRVEVVPDAATQGGHAFDQALNHRYKKLGSAAVDPATEAEMEAIIDAAYKDVELPLEEFRTPARYKEVLRAYNAHWGAEPFKVLGVQVPFAVQLGEVPVTPDFWLQYFQMAFGASWETRPDFAGVMYPTVKVLLHGILDLYIEWLGHTMIMDTKTSKSDIDGNYENSAQMKAYCWALQELARVNPEAGLPTHVHGAMINGVTIRPPYKAAERVAKATDKPRNSFQRITSLYTQDRLDEWRKDTLRWVQTALGWVADNHYPANERHCTFHQDASFINYGYYGKPCPYLDVCTSPADVRLAKLESDQFMDYKRGPLAGTENAVQKEA